MGDVVFNITACICLPIVGRMAADIWVRMCVYIKIRGHASSCKHSMLGETSKVCIFSVSLFKCGINLLENAFECMYSQVALLYLFFFLEKNVSSVPVRCPSVDFKFLLHCKQNERQPTRSTVHFATTVERLRNMYMEPQFFFFYIGHFVTICAPFRSCNKTQ